MKLPRADPGGFLFFDLAGVTGFAYACPGQDPVSNEIAYPHVSSWGRMLTAHAQALWEMVDTWHPRVIGYEAAIRLQTDHEHNVRTAFGLAGQTEAIAFQAKAECLSAAPSTIRAKVLHDGRLAKATAKTTVRRWTLERGWPTIGHNAADALVGLTWAMQAKGCAPAMLPWTGHRFWRAELL